MNNIFKRRLRSIIMRYEYTITQEGGETEVMKAMSWKKVLGKADFKENDLATWTSETESESYSSLS